MIINATKPYAYITGKLDAVAEFASRYGKVAVVSDQNAFALHGDKLQSALKRANISCICYEFEAGEECKTTETVKGVYEFLLKNEYDRGDLVLAFGGGVVSDVAGFAAATYKRGIDYLNVPTTLLAAIDASIGGKTGVNLCGLKNQIGCFYPPVAVVCDTSLFATLSEEEKQNGLAEAVKYMALGAFKSYEGVDDLVQKCVAYKAKLTETDPFDKGDRRLLNFGHTFGHAIEAATDGAVKHGLAVACGMLIMTALTEKNGLSAVGTLGKLKAALADRKIPTADYDVRALKEYIKADKKISSDTITIAYLKDFGTPSLIVLPCEEFFRGEKWI